MARVQPIHAHVAAVFAAALAVAAIALSQDPVLPFANRDPLFWNALAALLVLAVVSETAFLKLPIGTVTSTVVFIPYLAAVVLLGPSWAMLIVAVTTSLAEAAIRRKPPIKLVHNTAKEALAIGTAGLVYRQLGGVPSIANLDDLSLIAFAAAVGVYITVSSGATSVAVSLSTGTPLRDAWRRVVGGSLLFDFLASPIALLLAFLYVKAQLWGIIVVTVPLFLVRHVYSVNLQIEQVNRDLLELMVKAIEARDPYTSGHSLRVSRIAAALARGVGLPPKQVEQIETAALLHDVGKIHQEYALVLRKAGGLSPEEAALMRTHPIRSYELVRTISGFRGGVAEAVRHHHENYDGSGYPDGLAGEQIPVGARIIMIADTADAMTTDRPYRTALSYDELVAELDRYANSQFDPGLVRSFRSNAQIRAMLDAELVEQGFTRSTPGTRVARLA